MSDQISNQTEINQEVDNYISIYAKTLEKFFDANINPLQNFDPGDPSIVDKVDFLLADFILATNKMRENQPISEEAGHVLHFEYKDEMHSAYRLITREIELQKLFIGISTADEATLVKKQKSAKTSLEEFDDHLEILDGKEAYKRLLKKITNFHNTYTLPMLGKVFEV